MSLLSFSPARAGGVEGGAGVAAGGTFDDPFEFAVSPLLVARWDPFPWKVRPTVGVATLPTFLYTTGGDYYVSPIVIGELGVAYGSETHRIALVGHGGLFSYGAGIQYTLLAWKLGKRVNTGFELRATWLGPRATYLGAMWTFRIDPDHLEQDLYEYD